MNKRKISITLRRLSVPLKNAEALKGLTFLKRIFLTKRDLYDVTIFILIATSVSYIACQKNHSSGRLNSVRSSPIVNPPTSDPGEVPVDPLSPTKKIGIDRYYLYTIQNVTYARAESADDPEMNGAIFELINNSSSKLELGLQVNGKNPIGLSWDKSMGLGTLEINGMVSRLSDIYQFDKLDLLTKKSFGYAIILKNDVLDLQATNYGRIIKGPLPPIPSKVYTGTLVSADYRRSTTLNRLPTFLEKVCTINHCTNCKLTGTADAGCLWGDFGCVAAQDFTADCPNKPKWGIY